MEPSSLTDSIVDIIFLGVSIFILMLIAFVVVFYIKRDKK